VTICGFVVFKSSAGYWRLSRIYVDGSCSRQNTIQVYGDHVVLDHNDVTNHHRSQSCLMIGSRYGGIASDVRVHHNRIHDCGPGRYYHGIYAGAARTTRITNNYIYRNGGNGIQLYPDSQGTLVERNVVDASMTEDGLIFAGQRTYASSNNLVRRNIFSHNRRYGIASSWGTRIGTGNVAEANCFWENAKGSYYAGDVGYTRRGNIDADPRFAAENAADYRLARRSPCKRMQPRGPVGP
jgi:parallel beta-helix repeat protein